MKTKIRAYVTRTQFNKLFPLLEDKNGDKVVPVTTEDLDAEGTLKINTLDGEIEINVFYGRED